MQDSEIKRTDSIINNDNNRYKDLIDANSQKDVKIEKLNLEIDKMHNKMTNYEQQVAKDKSENQAQIDQLKNTIDQKIGAIKELNSDLITLNNE